MSEMAENEAPIATWTDLEDGKPAGTRI